jgi:hypothetical protein
MVDVLVVRRQGFEPGPADVAKVRLNVRLQSSNQCSDLAVLT